MSAPTITISPKAASEPGALDGWEARCSCGYSQSTSLSEREARMLAIRHAEWHAPVFVLMPKQREDYVRVSPSAGNPDSQTYPGLGCQRESA